MKNFVKTPEVSGWGGERETGARVVVTLGTKRRAVRLMWSAVHTRESIVRPVFNGEVPAGAVKAFEDDQQRMEKGSNEASINMIRVDSRGWWPKPFQLRVEVHRESRKQIWFDGIFRPGLMRNAWQILWAQEPVRIVGRDVVFNAFGRCEDEAPEPLTRAALLERARLVPGGPVAGDAFRESSVSIPEDLPVRVPAAFQNYVLARRVRPSGCCAFPG
ncbi:MAG TPA: hypothetical protein VHM91_19850 [Verrucomicrobiales bacterium]|nr:hypothetical protein [Verrucomicrobiales bacterium]